MKPPVRTFAAAALVMLAAACRGDETVRAYGAGDKVWYLVSLNDAAFADTATLTFPKRGQIAGKGPCNTFTATLDVPYPWFETGALLATRRVCPGLAAETAYFNALGRVTLSEVAGDTLLLSNPDGLVMEFRSGG